MTIIDAASRLDEAGRRNVNATLVWGITAVYVPESAVTHHARIVAHEAARRRFITMTGDLHHRARRGDDVDALAEEAQHTLGGFQAALSLCNRGPVAFTSLEMSNTELELRMVSQEARVDMGRITRRQLNNDDWARVAQARERWDNLPLFIDPSHDATMAQVARHAWSVKRKHGLAAVIVDYLQLMESPDRGKKEYEVVTENSRKLKLLAQALEVPVIALSQLNRGSEHRDGKVPQLSDLRSSGAVEQDADVVILMHRDLLGSPHEAELIIAKNRHGVTGTAEMDFIGHHSQLRDRQRPTGYTAYAA